MRLSARQPLLQYREQHGASLATLQSLFSQLSADQSLVHLRSGGGSTLGEYVRNAHKKLLRRARQEESGLQLEYLQEQVSVLRGERR